MNLFSLLVLRFLLPPTVVLRVFLCKKLSFVRSKKKAKNALSKLNIWCMAISLCFYSCSQINYSALDKWLLCFGEICHFWILNLLAEKRKLAKSSWDEGNEEWFWKQKKNLEVFTLALRWWEMGKKFKWKGNWIKCWSL